MASTFDKSKQLYGRQKITTNLRFVGEANADILTIKQVLANALDIHAKNVAEETKLWNTFVNDGDTWTKTKQSRSDINNKVTLANGWLISRTLNGYCFGEPVKYISRKENKQKEVEALSQYLDFACNQNSTTNATLSSSICGLGYKLVLPVTKEEYEDSGVPFKINKDIIYPQEAFVVYTDEAIPEKIMGVLIGTYTNEDGEDISKYTCWTKDFQVILIESDKDESGYEVLDQAYGFFTTKAYPIISKKIPLIEIERNAFRKGDWEVVTDLMELSSRLTSNRVDDIVQIVDYILVLTNCGFKDDKEKDSVLSNRLIELEVTNPNVKPTVEILKNAIDQNGIQTFVDYIERKIEEIVGIPTRDERSGGGHDTGTAVKYRNGFRDLENNAGWIIPKFEKAEIEFITACIATARVFMDSNIGDLKPFEVRLKFPRSLNDDVVSSANAFYNFVNAGMDYESALVVSGAVSDPSETTKKIMTSFENNQNYHQLINSSNVKEEVEVKEEGNNGNTVSNA